MPSSSTSARVAERPHHLLGRGRHDHDLATLGLVLLDEPERLGEDDRRDHFVERLAHDPRDVVAVPPLDHVEHRDAQLLHLVLVRTDQHEDDLRVRAAHDGALREQTLAVEGTTERED
jgi:hypothetical protein